MNIQDIVNEHIAVAKSLSGMEKEILEASKICEAAILRGNKILLAGNGGSAADAQHIAAEFVGRYVKNRASMPAIALTTDSSALTAIANDYGFEHVFSRQLEGLGTEGDVFIGISTSGNSANIVKAVEVARQKRIKIILLLGNEGGALGKKRLVADENELLLIVPSKTTARVQEMHIFIGHIICQYLEN